MSFPRFFLFPYFWFRNIIRLLEKRPYSAYPLLLFCGFVGIARMLGEWLIGSHPLFAILPDVFGYVVFYWHLFFIYGLILFLLVPQPWRKSINVLLVGIFLGVLPPIVDFFVYAPGEIRYGYFWTFPTDWHWGIYNPSKDFHFGETFILWLTVALTASYVAYKTRSWVRMLLAALLGYGVVLTQGAIVPTVIRQLWSEAEWQSGHFVYMLGAAQTLLALSVYAVMQKKLVKGLLSRVQHALPFVVMSLLGAAYAGGLTLTSLWYAWLVFFLFITALVQNDYHDAADDAMQGRTPYVDVEDVRFFTITASLFVLGLLIVNSVTGVLLLLILILSFLYSYPYYRAKLYFPSNLKIEGCWGLASFLVGLTGTLEQQLLQMPRWEIAGVRATATFLDAPGRDAIVAAFLVFGGHTLLAVLKDYKDAEADAAAGVSTVYTLAAQRGYALPKVHFWVGFLALLCIALPLPLLYTSSRITLGWMLGGLALFIPFLFVIGKVSDRRYFSGFLWLMTGYLLYLLTALLQSS